MPRYCQYRDFVIRGSWFVVRGSWFVKVALLMQRYFLWGICTSRCEKPVQVETSKAPESGGGEESEQGIVLLLQVENGMKFHHLSDF